MRVLSILALAFSLTFYACSPVVKVTKADDVNLSDYKSFYFMEFTIDNQTELEPQKANLELILQAIRKELKAKGMTEKKDPDLKINIGLLVTPEVSTRETSITDAPIYMGQRNYHWESEEIVVHSYEKGTLYVDLISSADNKVVWEGITNGTISKSQEKNAKRIINHVEKMFENFPD